jgi:leucyl aminopeptidase (aminopeptidase T)
MNMEVNRNVVDAAKKLILDCMGTKQDEKLVIVADEGTFELGYGFAAAGRECGIETTFVEAPIQEKGEPPEPVAAAMIAADVEFLLTSMSYSHVKARVEATDKGARVASMPMMTLEIAENYLNADYPYIKKVSEKYSDMLSKASVVRVVTGKGTDITMDITGREAHADTGLLTEPGALGNLPAGEAYLAPLENDANGRIVVDGCIAYVGPVEDDIILDVKDGRIVEISGEKSAQALRDFLEDKDDEATGIAEFGIGTNPGAKIIGHPLVDEKVWGTIHIAFGMSTSIGGTRDSSIHYDCIINSPTVWIDDVKIMEKGEHITLG